MTPLERYLESKRPQSRCPFCDCIISPDNSIVREGKQIISSIPIKEDINSTTYLQRSKVYKYRCCSRCNKVEELITSGIKILYYIGIALIGIGFFIHTTILLIGVGLIFFSIILPFVIVKLSGRKYGASYERVKETGALIE